MATGERGIENPPRPQVFRFGTFQVDARSGELLRQGIRVKLQEQPFQVLIALLERPGEVITREELRDRIWSAGTFVDFEHSLNTAIKKLRQALGDTADNPRFVETLPRRGYRFIAPVSTPDTAAPVVPIRAETSSLTEERPPDLQPLPHGAPTPEAAPAAASIATVTTTPAPGTSRAFLRIPTWLLVTLALVLLVGGVIVGAWLSGRDLTRAAQRPLSLTPLTTYMGSEDTPSISPDGERVVFAWDGGEGDRDTYNLYSKVIGTEQPIRLTNGDYFDISPTYSPDGRYIAYNRCFAKEKMMLDCGMYLMPALGGSERRIRKMNWTGTMGFVPDGQLSWSPDGRILAFVDQSPAGNFAVHTMSIETLEARQITTPPEIAVGDTSPTISPDGRTIAFVRNAKEAADIHVVPIEGGPVRRLTHVNQVAMMGTTWAEDGKSIIYGGFGLWRVPIEGGEPESILPTSDAVLSPTVRRNRLVFSSHKMTEGIWSLALPKPTKLERFINSTRSDESPRYSPDGKQIVFQSTRTGNFEIWRASADGSNPLKLTSFNGPLTGSPRWSPDGQTIVFDSRPDGNANIFAINPDGGPPKRLTSDATDEVMPSYSRDGEWIYFASNRGANWNVWKMPAKGGDAIQVTKSGGFTAIESPDGRYVYYAKGLTEPGLWRVPVGGGEETMVLPDLPPSLYGYFTVDEHGVYYVSGKSMKEPLHVSYFDLATGKSRKIFDLPKTPVFAAPGLELSPQKDKLLIVIVTEFGGDLQMVENFR